MASSAKRIGKELAEINENPPVGMKISLANDSELHEWIIVVDGPQGSPYAGGKFTLHLHLPIEYPFKPPTITFKTRIYHPNISNDDTGAMCLGVLKPDVWKPSSKISSVLLATKQLLAEPVPDDAVETGIAEIYKSNRKLFNDNVKDHMKKHMR